MLRKRGCKSIPYLGIRLFFLYNFIVAGNHSGHPVPALVLLLWVHLPTNGIGADHYFCSREVYRPKRKLTKAALLVQVQRAAVKRSTNLC